MRQSAQFTVALLRRIRDFLVRTPPAVALGDIKIHIETLTGIADQLSTLAIEQDTRSRQGRAGTSTLRHHLRVVEFEFMRPVSMYARTNLHGWHGYGLAVDVVHRERRWSAGERWFREVARVFRRHGCRWGGDFATPDLPHFQWGRCRLSPSALARQIVREWGVEGGGSGEAAGTCCRQSVFRKARRCRVAWPAGSPADAWGEVRTTKPCAAGVVRRASAVTVDESSGKASCTTCNSVGDGKNEVEHGRSYCSGRGQEWPRPGTREELAGDQRSLTYGLIYNKLLSCEA